MNQPPIRILHVLASSVPTLNGYTIRSKAIVDAQRQDGFDPIVTTSPYYPDTPASKEDVTLDGTRYLRVQHPTDAPQECKLDQALFGVAEQINKARRWYKARAPKSESAPKRKSSPAPFEPNLLTHAKEFAYNYIWAAGNQMLMQRFTDGLERIVEQERPQIIHAHSPFRCGLPALQVARRYNIPMIYEVRGVWEESQVADVGEWKRETPLYKRWRDSETQVMREADAVVCICEQLKDEVVARGVNPSRVIIVPNAVDPAQFQPIAPDAQIPPQVQEVKRKLRGLTLGYIGSLRKLEGVEELVRGAAEMLHRGRDISLLIVGSGDNFEELKALAAELGLGERAIFTGRVPHELVAYYYELIEAFVISRPNLRVTQTVTPLKPLEAMAMQRPMVVSDLPALRELVQEGRTGLFYPAGDPSALADQCAKLQDDPELRRRLSTEARRWVLEERTWSKVEQSLYPTYHQFAGR